MDNHHHHHHHHQELGISVELDPEVAQDLRQQEEKRRRKRDIRKQQLQQQQQGDDDDDDDDDFNNDFDRLQNEAEDDWNQVIQTIENATGREKIPGNNDGGSGEAFSEAIKSSDDKQDDDDDEEEEEDIIERDEISLAPDDPMASSLPVVLVNISRLVGYQPSSLDEVECLTTQIQSALYGQEQQPSSAAAAAVNSVDDDDDQENTEPTTTTTATENDPEITTNCDDDFDGRLVEMFTNNSAHHSDTVRVAQLQRQQPYSFAVVPYPDLLCRKQQQQQRDPTSTQGGDVPILEEEATTTTVVVYTTRQIWKSLLKRHVVPVVDRIFVHLRNCSRSLLWKYDMRRELLELCQCQSRQLQQDKLNAWRGAGVGQRREKLAKLYHVREMFVHRLEMAQEHVDILNNKREEAVQQALRLRRNQTGQAMGVEALDFATTSVMSFPTQQEMNQLGVSIGNSLIIGLQDDDDDGDYDAYYEDDYVPISSDDEEEEEYDDFAQNDGLSPGPETAGLDDEVDGGVTDTVATIDETTAAAADEILTSGGDAAECVDNFLSDRVANRERRRQAARQRRSHQVATAKEEEHKAKLEAAKKDEERMREACTTQEHKVAMAKVQCFQDRLNGVDNLLESLQEDEWADEETTEGEEQSGRVAPIGENGVSAKKDGERDDRMEFTMLDQVLLRVLGSIRVPAGTRAADHAAWLRTEHLEIVADWKEHFGSLPPFLKPSSPGLLDQHGGAPFSPRASPSGSSAAFQAGVAAHTVTTNVGSGGQASATRAAWGPNAAATSPQQHVSVSRPAHEMRQSLGIVDNEAEDWEA